MPAGMVCYLSGLGIGQFLYVATTDQSYVVAALHFMLKADAQESRLPMPASWPCTSDRAVSVLGCRMPSKVRSALARTTGGHARQIPRLCMPSLCLRAAANRAS